MHNHGNMCHLFWTVDYAGNSNHLDKKAGFQCILLPPPPPKECVQQCLHRNNIEDSVYTLSKK